MAMSCAVICLVALLLCRSRSGVAALIFGALFAFGWVRSRGGYFAIPVVTAGVIASVVIMALPSGMRAGAVDRFQDSFNKGDATAVVADARLKHWPDGLRAGLSYLPAGSGLATYGYAYLPFQETSPWRWYHHADNLWLELFVEQGLVGLALFVGIFGLTMLALLKMAFSHDPMDEALRITGWYILGSILVSQVFDFGLIAPANLLLVSCMLPVFQSRSHEVPRFSEANGATVETPILATKVQTNATAATSWPTLATNLVAASLSLTVASLATLRLGRDATSDHLVQQAKFELNAVRTDEPLLKDWIEKLQQANRQSPSAPLCHIISDYQYELARLNEVSEIQPQTNKEASEAYRKTARSNRRLEFRKGNKLGSEGGQSEQIYQASLKSIQQGLQLRPLALEPRVGQIYLEFAHKDMERSKAAIVQAGKLYRNSPKLLFQLGR